MNGPLIQTISAVNYLPFVFVMCETLQKQMPSARLCILLTDVSRRVLDQIRETYGQFAELICCDDLGFDGIEPMRKYYSVLEFSSACKVLALDYQLRTRGERECIFIDPDTMVFGDFSVPARALGSEIAVTPHTSRPYPEDGELPTATELVATGYVNGGFIYAKNSQCTLEILGWLVSQTRHNWFIAPTFGLYGDQHWLSLLLLFFRDAVRLLRHPGVNVAYWNLHERPIRQAGTKLMVGEDLEYQLLLFHFSGFCSPSNGRLTRHSNRRFDVKTEQILKSLIAEYDQALKRERKRTAITSIKADHCFSRRPLLKRMKIAEKCWGVRFVEVARPPGRFGRLGGLMDRLLG
jgi:hypothetical protein